MTCPLLLEGGHSPPILCHTQIADGSKLLRASITRSDRSVPMMDCERYNCKSVPRHYARIKVNGTKSKIKMYDDQLKMTLEIDPVRRSDEGWISCNVYLKNNVTFSSQCDLWVIAVPEKPVCSYQVVSRQVLVTCTTAKVFPRAGCVWTLNFREIQSPIMSDTPKHKEFYVKGVTYYRTMCSCRFKVQGSGRYRVDVSMYPLLTGLHAPAAEVVVNQQLDISIDEASIEYFVFSYIYGNESHLTSSTGLSSRVICQTSGNPEPFIVLYFKNHLDQFTHITSTVGQLLDFSFQPTECPFNGQLICTAQNSLNVDPVNSTIKVNCSRDYCDTTSTSINNTAGDNLIDIRLCIRSSLKATQFYVHPDITPLSKSDKRKQNTGLRNVTAITNEDGTAHVTVNRIEFRGGQWLQAVSQSVSFPVVEFKSRDEVANEDNKSEDLPECPSNVQISEDGLLILKWRFDEQNRTHAVLGYNTSFDEVNVTGPTSVSLVPNTTSYSLATPHIVYVDVENQNGKISCPFWIVNTSTPEVQKPSCRIDPITYNVAIVLASVLLLIVCVLAVNKMTKKRKKDYELEENKSIDQGSCAVETNGLVSITDPQNVEQCTSEFHEDNNDNETQERAGHQNERVRHAGVFPRVFYRMGGNLKTFQEHLSQNFLNSYFSLKVAPRDKGDVAKPAADHKAPVIFIDHHNEGP